MDTVSYVSGGTLRYDAACYVERGADRDLHRALSRGAFCYVLTSRQMGKSSLMVRTAARLRGEGVSVAVLDLAGIGQNLSPSQWYDGLLVRLGRQLRIQAHLDSFWDDNERLGPCQRWIAAVRDVALAACPGRLVIFVDEIDVVRSLPFSTDEFFAAIRECYNARAEEPDLERLTFCLVGVSTPSELMRDARLTPFNIGQRIELVDFTPAEAAPLAAGMPWPQGMELRTWVALGARKDPRGEVEAIPWTEWQALWAQLSADSAAGAAAGDTWAPSVPALQEG